MINNIKINNSYFIIFLIVIIISTLYINLKKKNIENNDNYYDYDITGELFNEKLSDFFRVINIYIFEGIGQLNTSSELKKFSQHNMESNSIESKPYRIIETLNNNIDIHFDNIVEEYLLVREFTEEKYNQYPNNLEAFKDYYFNIKMYNSNDCLKIIIYYVFINQLGVFFMDMDYLAEKISQNSENLNSDGLNYSGDAIREIVTNILNKLNTLTSNIYNRVNTNELTTYRTLIDRLKENDNNDENSIKNLINIEIIDIIKSDVVTLLNLYEKNGMKETTFNNIIIFNTILPKFKIFKENYLNDSDIDLIIDTVDMIMIRNNIPQQYPTTISTSNSSSNDESIMDFNLILNFFS